MPLLKILLIPFSLLYYLYQLIRNKLFDLNILKTVKFNFPIISIGNLSLGGTGKTPLANYLITKLKSKYNVTYLSRGYMRNSSGYIMANEYSSVNEIGDEPHLIKQNHKDISVVVCENRVYGIQASIYKKNESNLFILDDAFQNRALKASVNIVLSKFNQPFFNDFIIPSGNLREPASGINRANIIIISKCPIDLSETTKNDFVKKINSKSNQKIFFTTIKYKNYILGKYQLNHEKISKKGVVLVTGIADSTNLENFLNEKNIIFDHLKFKDHHKYSKQDINLIKSKSKNKNIITTKKDYFKILDIENLENLFYQDINIEFLFNDENNFIKELNKFIM
tara:strand:+ start:35 stop:1048 length:1014 start_codon:yes stop_codon:yes gene_type:complete